MGGRRRRAPAGRVGWLGLVLALVAVAAVATSTWHPASVALRTALVLPDLFPQAPVRPLAWFTPEPVREEVHFSEAVPDANAHLYYLPDGRRHGAIILLLGARPFPKDDPQLVDLASGLARAGAAVMIIETPDLSDGLIRPSEVVPIADAWRFLSHHPQVDPARIGYVALSVGGSLLLLALAEDREFGAGLTFANVFGAYYDAHAMVYQMATGTMIEDGRTELWAPAPLAKQIFAGALIDVIEDLDARDVLWRYFVQLDAEAEPQLTELSGEAAVLRDLLLEHDPERVTALIAALPPAVHERLRAVSPSWIAGQLRTPLFVMHDRGDHYVPYVESRRLVEHLPPGTLRRYTEFELFEHVNPTKPLAPLDFARELATLYRHLYDMLLIVL